MIDKFIRIVDGAWINSDHIIHFFVNGNDIVINFANNLKFLYMKHESNELAIKALDDRMKGIIPWNSDV